ncbi:MAG: XkdF-like putative serine protease domain-containing protein, partial [Flammeovirgaceae bacterium]
MDNFTIELQTTLSKAKQKVYGWGNVATVNGQPVIDQKGNHIPIAVLDKAVKGFMLSGGRVNFNHESMDAPQRGVVSQSVVLSAEMAQALGVQTDREGWLVEIDVTDADAWQVVESGLIKGLSLGGSSKILTGEEEIKRLSNDPNAPFEDVRLVTELSIQELSLVFAPANQFSDVTMILGNERADMNQDEMNKRLEELQAQVTQLSSENQELVLKLSA